METDIKHGASKWVFFSNGSCLLTFCVALYSTLRLRFTQTMEVVKLG